MLQQEAHESHVQKTIKRLKARATRRRLPLEVLQTYSGALHGFLVKMSSDVVHLVQYLRTLQKKTKQIYVLTE